MSEIFQPINPTNTNVNAAIAEDPSASLDALQVSGDGTKPTITGEAFIGEILNANNVGIAPIQWFVNGVAVAGESGPTYTIRPVDAGQVITCSNANGVSDPVTVWHPKDLPQTRAVFLPFRRSTFRNSRPDIPVGQAEGVAAWTNDVDSYERATAISVAASRPIYYSAPEDGWPTIRFDGVAHNLTDTATGLTADMLQDVPAGYIIAAVSGTNLTGGESTQTAVHIRGGSTGSRLNLTMRDSGSSLFSAAGRTLDGDSIVSASIQSVNGWWVLSSEADFSGGKIRLRQDGVVVAEATLASSGNTSDTVSGGIKIGAVFSGGSTGSWFTGSVGAVVIVSGTLTTDELRKVERFVGACIDRETAQREVFFWNNQATTAGSWSALTKTDTLALAPDGATPDEAAPATHRYHHAPCIARHPVSGRICVAMSSALANEEEAGQQIALISSTDKGSTWSTPTALVPAQSASNGTVLQPGSRVALPTCWITSGSQLFFVAGIDEGNFEFEREKGLAMVAREVNGDGTLGTLYRISEEVYSAIDGKAEITFNQTLRDLLFEQAKIYGLTGSSALSEPQVSWSFWDSHNGRIFAEPATFAINDTGTQLARLWRSFTIGAEEPRTYVAFSEDSGATFTKPFQTNVPSAPSLTRGLRLSTGDIAIIGNQGGTRAAIYLAIFAPTTMRCTAVYNVVSGATASPVYPGTMKGSGAAYPDLIQVGNYLYVTYSWAKEDIYFSRILVPGLADNNND